MFKFIRNLFFICLVFSVILIGGIMFISYRNYSNLVKDFKTVSNDIKSNQSSNNNNNDDTGNDELGSSESNSNFSISDIKNSTETATISPAMSDIVSDDNNYDLLVKYDDTTALVYFNKETKKASIVSLEDSNAFDSLSSETDKYINFDNYSMEDLENLKDSFLSGDISKKYSIVNEVLNSTDTNIKESDLISMYLSYASN